MKLEVFCFDPKGLFELEVVEVPKGFVFDQKGVVPVVDFENGFDDFEKGLFYCVLLLIAEGFYLEKGF